MSFKFTFTADGERLRSVEASCLTKAVEQVPQLAAAKVWSFMRERTDNGPAINLSMVSQSAYDKMKSDLVKATGELRERLRGQKEEIHQFVCEIEKLKQIISDLRNDRNHCGGDCGDCAGCE